MAKVIGHIEPATKAYIGVKMIMARPMDRGQYNKYRGWEIPEDEDPNDPGYLVTYPESDGYESWSPRKVFDAAYFPLTGEGVIALEDVQAFVPKGGVLTSKLGAKTTVAQAKCITGFEITDSSACVLEENYDQAMGTKIVIERIQNKLWGHLGFVLQWALNGLSQ